LILGAKLGHFSRALIALGSNLESPVSQVRWETFQNAKTSDQENMLLRNDVPKKRRKRRRRNEIIAGDTQSIDSSLGPTE